MLHPIRGGVALFALGFVGAAQAAVHDDLATKSLDQIRIELSLNKTTSEALVRAYIERIEAIDRAGPKLQSVLVLNPDAVAQAKALDAERVRKRLRGPLHGVPILIKDNIETLDPMATTAGSLALESNVTKRDAPIVANLRAAGAIILGKTNLSEWANFRSENSVSGWSGIGGLTKNPHVLDRSACGSSSGSGSAIAAGLAAAAIGTETDGSIVCPSSMTGIVGLKPTLGLLSGQRIVPIAHSQDTAGPMGHSVRDVAIVLDALVGKQPACEPPAQGCKRADYLAGLSNDALRGKRIGVLRFKTPHLQTQAAYERALEVIRKAGATLVEVPTPEMDKIFEGEDLVLHTEFKADLNAYLATLPASIQTRTLGSLIAFNASTPRETVVFGQEIFTKAEGTLGLKDHRYLEALATSKRLAGPEGIDKLLKDSTLDLLVAPTTGTAWRLDTSNGDHFSGGFSTLSAVSGYPHLTVPMGAYRDLPIGLSFIGTAWTEDKLLAAGYAYEQASKAKVKPKFLPSIDEGNPGFERGVR